MTDEKIELPVEFVERFPGLWVKNSDSDKWVKKVRRLPSEDGDFFRVSGDLVRAGVIREDELAIHNEALQVGQIDGEIARICDRKFLEELDYRIRFCRAILSCDFAIKWTNDGNPIWTLEHPPEGDPLDELAISGIGLRVGSHAYYALKFLRHFRRFDVLSDANQGDSFGAWRELIFLGETWSEARLVLNFGEAVVTGKKQRKWLKNLRETKNRNAQENVKCRRDAIFALLRETNRTGGALTSWVKEQLFARHKITVSERTIRDDLRALRQ